MTSSALLLVVCVASFTSLSSSDGVSDNQPPKWKYLNENGTYVTRDWRKSITTKLVLSSTKRPTLASRPSPAPTTRLIVTRPTQPSTTEPTKPTRQTTTIGNVHLRRPSIATVTGVTHSKPTNPVTPNRTVTGNSQAVTEAATDAVDKSTTAATEPPKLVTDGKRGKDTPNDLAVSNTAPIVRLSAVLTAFVSAAVLLVFTTY